MVKTLSYINNRRLPVIYIWHWFHHSSSLSMRCFCSHKTFPNKLFSFHFPFFYDFLYFHFLCSWDCTTTVHVLSSILASVNALGLFQVQNVQSYLSGSNREVMIDAKVVDHVLNGAFSKISESVKRNFEEPTIHLQSFSEQSHNITSSLFV